VLITSAAALPSRASRGRGAAMGTWTAPTETTRAPRHVSLTDGAQKGPGSNRSRDAVG